MSAHDVRRQRITDSSRLSIAVAVYGSSSADIYAHTRHKRHQGQQIHGLVWIFYDLLCVYASLIHTYQLAFHAQF